MKDTRSVSLISRHQTAQTEAGGSYLSDQNADFASKSPENTEAKTRKRTRKHESDLVLNTDATGNQKASMLPI